MSPNRPGDCSGTPLATKLGILEDSRLYLIGLPDGFEALLDLLPQVALLQTQVSRETDIVQPFVTPQSDLHHHLARLRTRIRPDSAVRVSWPKRASGAP